MVNGHSTYEKGPKKKWLFETVFFVGVHHKHRGGCMQLKTGLTHE